MWYIILVVVLTLLITLGIILSKNYRKRYRECLADVDEAILDTINAVNIIMFGCDPLQIDCVVLETIETNVLIQRIFTKHNVIYTTQPSRRWIQKRIEKVKKDNQK